MKAYNFELKKDDGNVALYSLLIPLIIGYTNTYISFTDFKMTMGLYHYITFTMTETRSEHVNFYFYGNSSEFKNYIENNWTVLNRNIRIDTFALGF